MLRFVQLQPLEMVASAEEANRYQADFLAPATGELSLFANDAILLFDLDDLYENNEGAARVTVVSATHAAAVAAAAQVKNQRAGATDTMGPAASPPAVRPPSSPAEGATSHIP
jgi:hypothetical protein